MKRGESVVARKIRRGVGGTGVRAGRGGRKSVG